MLSLTQPLPRAHYGIRGNVKIVNCNVGALCTVAMILISMRTTNALIISVRLLFQFEKERRVNLSSFCHLKKRFPDRKIKQIVPPPVLFI